MVLSPQHGPQPLGPQHFPTCLLSQALTLVSPVLQQYLPLSLFSPLSPILQGVSHPRQSAFSKQTSFPTSTRDLSTPGLPQPLAWPFGCLITLDVLFAAGRQLGQVVEAAGPTYERPLEP